jgi:hypothetical protein
MDGKSAASWVAMKVAAKGDRRVESSVVPTDESMAVSWGFHWAVDSVCCWAGAMECKLAERMVANWAASKVVSTDATKADSKDVHWAAGTACMKAAWRASCWVVRMDGSRAANWAVMTAAVMDEHSVVHSAVWKDEPTVVGTEPH